MSENENINNNINNSTIPKGMKVCKTCGKPIAKNAKVCPNCGAKQKGKFGLIIGIILILLLLSSISGGRKSSTSSSQKKEKEETAVTEEKSVLAEEADDTDAEKIEQEEPEEKTEAEKNLEFIEEYYGDFIVLAQKPLDNYIANYDVPYRRKDWTISKFDSTDTLIGITKVTWENRKWDYVYVGTLNFDESGKVVSITHHYAQIGNEVLLNDGYCDEFFENLAEIEEMFSNEENADSE